MRPRKKDLENNEMVLKHLLWKVLHVTLLLTLQSSSTPRTVSVYNPYLTPHLSSKALRAASNEQ